MPSRVTVPIDSVDAGPAPLLTDITMPSVMPMSMSAAVPPQSSSHAERRRGSATNNPTTAAGPAIPATATKPTAAAPTSIIRNKFRPRDASASGGGRVTFARDTRTGSSSNDQKIGEESKDRRRASTNARSGADTGCVHRHHGRSGSARGGGDNASRRGRRTSLQNYQSDRYQQRDRYENTCNEERDREHKTPSNSNSNSRSSKSTSRRTEGTVTSAYTRPTSNRLNAATTSISTASSTSSSTRKNENVCRNRLESALRDQFDTSFTGSQGLSTLIGRKDMLDAAAAATDAITAAAEPAAARENVAPNILAGGRNRKREVGPNERKYKDRYAKSVDKAISRHHRDRPDRPLRDYRAMTDVEKAMELDKVGSLLARLGIADNFSSGGRSTSSVAAAPNNASVSSSSGITIGQSTASCSATSHSLLNQRSQSSSRSLARTGKDDVDDSRTTMGALSSEENMDVGVDDSRTTANCRDAVSTSSSRRGLGEDVDDSRTTMGSPSLQKQSQQDEQHQENQQRVEITGCPSSGHSANHNSTIDDSRTTMGNGNASVTNGANDTTACSSTRIDQSSLVFDFGGGCDGADNGNDDCADNGNDDCADNGNDDCAGSVTSTPRADVNHDGARPAHWSDLDTTCESMRTPHNPGPRRRGGTGMKNNNDNNDGEGEMADDSDEIINSPREDEKAEYARGDDVQQTQYQQGITRMEDSHFTCNADAGTVAETQGAISVAQPKLLFEMQTPQFERGSSNKQGDYESEEDSFDEGDKRNNDTSHSGDTTAQSRSLLSNNQGSTPSEGFRRTPINRRTSCSPVELPRSAIKGRHDNDDEGDRYYRRDVSSQSQSFQSPVVKSSFASSRKRLATTSGKRGADQQRSRINRDRDGFSDNMPNDANDDDDIMGQLDDDDNFGDCPSEQIDSPSQMHCSSIQSPPPEFEAGTPSFLVGASQSPILQCDDDESMNYEQSMEFRRHQSPPLSSSRPHQQLSGRHRKQSSQAMSSQRRDQIASPSFSQQTPAFSDHSNVEQTPEYSQGPPPMDEDKGKPLNYRASSSGWASPNRDMSIDDDNGNSQSDFSPEEQGRLKKTAGGEGARWRDINLPARKGGGARSRKSIMDDTVESVNCTVLPRRDRNRRERGEEYSRDIAPADIHMKIGESYRLDPLRVRRPVGQKKHDRDQSRRRRRASSVDTPHRRRGRSASRSRRGISRSPPTISFPDPLSSFDRRTADKLEVVADWLAEEDFTGEKQKKKSDDDDSVGWYSDDDSKSEDEVIGRGIVISCTLPQIFGVALKLFVTNGVEAKSAKKKRSPLPFGSQSRASTSSTLTGGTLIVLRDKEDLPEWEQVLRERTCYSVMNHATISSAERKRSKIAGKCAGFQVVLTTYDALKAKESSYALDDIGRAIYDDSGSQGGWMTSRSQSNRQSCEHLSVLHQLTWHRVIFMDVLGRQSYTCKPATARFKATIALNAKSRFIFFEKEKGSKCFLEDSFKESRKQLCAVATALHLPEEDAAEYIVNTTLLDLRDIQETEDHQDDVDESRYDDVSSVEDSDIEDGQQDRCDYESSRCHSDSEILMSPISRRRY